MKISIVLGPFQPLPPAGMGAVEKVWYELAGSLRRSGHDVILVGKCREARADARDNGIRIIPMRGFAATRSLLINLAKDLLYSVQVAIRMKRVDVTVTNSFWMPMVMSLRPKTAGKLVVHVARFPKGQMSLYRRADALQAISTAVAAEVIRQAPELSEKTFVLPYPVDLRVYSPPERRRDPDGELQILYVGRIHPEKGLEVLLRAFRNVVTKVPRARLKIVGPSSTEAGGGGAAFLDLLKRASAGLPVEFADPISDPPALSAALRNAYCFCYPSLADKGEAFGLAVLEAMATGLPVVVSSLECFKDFIENGRNGMVFDHRGPYPEAQLAECLSKILLDARFSAALGENAAAKARQFALDAVAARYLDFFEQLRGVSHSRIN